MNVREIIDGCANHAQDRLTSLGARFEALGEVKAAVTRASVERERLLTALAQLPTVTEVRTAAESVRRTCATWASAVRTFGNAARDDATKAGAELRRSVNVIVSPAREEAAAPTPEPAPDVRPVSAA